LPRSAKQAPDVQPDEEPVFILTSSQLQEIVERAIERATERIWLEIALDRQRIARLENPIEEPGKTDVSRAEKIEKYLKSRSDHKADFETLKGHLGVDKFALNAAIRTLINSFPGRYGIIKSSGDKRKRTLIMLPR
jgi:hypothetical protein